MTPSSHSLTEAELEQFIGTEHYYQSPLGIKYTDGIQYLAERAQAFWIIDAIASWQMEPQARGVTSGENRSEVNPTNGGEENR